MKTHKARNAGNSAADGSLINSTKLELDDDDKLIKTEVETSDAMCSDDEDENGEMAEDGDGDGDGEGDVDDGEDNENEDHENNDDMIILNTEGEQPELIINDSIENQA